MAQVRALYQLQLIDSEIKEKKQRLGDILRAQKESAELLAARQAAETASKTVQRWQTRRTDLNLELESLNSKAKRSEDRLYSGNVKNPKELSDLQHEIESLGRRRAALEDEILETMLELEEAEGERETAVSHLSTLETQFERNKAAYQQEQQEVALRLHKLTGERQKQAALLTPDSLKIYDTLAQRKGNIAVAALRGNQCQACFVTISAYQVREADQGKLTYCSGCGRILYPV
jgi:uncharacterized protein